MATKTMGKAEWHERISQFRDAWLVRQRTGTWRLTESRVCGSNDGPENGVAHTHSTTTTIDEQTAVNLLVDWGNEEDLADVEALRPYAAAELP